MQKGLTVPLLLFVVLIFLAAVLYLLYSQNYPKNSVTQKKEYFLPKATEKTESNIYQNKALGFEFQYGVSLTVKEDSEEEFNKRGGGDFRKNFKGYIGYEPGKFVGAVVVLDKEGSFETNPFTVWVFDNPQDLTIDSWHHDYWYYPFVWGDFTDTGKFILAPQEVATVSGQQGKSGIIDYREGKPKFIYLPKDQKMYLFRVIGQIGEQILATFKFLQ